MKTLLSRLLVAVVVLGPAVWMARPAQAQLGFAAGLNFDQTSDIEIRNRQTTVDNATGYHVGLFYDLAAGPVAIRPGVFLRNVKDVEYRVSDLATRRFDLNLIEVPIDLRVRVPFPVISPYALAGPVLTFASSSDDDYDESLRNVSMSANIGLGVEVAVPMLGWKLFPEVRYALGITPFVDDFEFLGATVTPEEDNQRMNAVMLRLGVAF